MAETITINAATREIKVPESEVNFGVAGERKVEKKHFRIEGRIVEGTDLALGFAWKVSCENAGKEPCADLIDSILADTEGIEFDWTVGAGPMAYKGDLKFAVCATKTDALGNILQEWHSQIGHGNVANGIEATVQNVGGQDLAAWLQQNATAAAKSAKDADNAAKRIKDSMGQITENKEAVSQLKKDKLDKPNNPVVGQFLRVKSISDTGEIVLETMAGGVGGGLPNGGTVGQVLAKKSDADGDAEWADMESEEVTADNITQALGYTPRKAWYVNVTPGNPITADKTAAEIWKAYQDGYSVFAMVVVDGLYPYTLPLVLPMDAETFGFAAVGQLSEDSAPMTVCLAYNAGEWRFFTCEIAPSDAIPKALKNPKALTLKIGSTTVTYDGSTAQTVEIADGTEVSY